MRGHHNMLNELKAHPMLGKLLLGIIPMNEAVSYAHRYHKSIYMQDPKAPASKAYAKLVGRLTKQMGV